ncbi:MAG: hypothetical protein JXR73_03525 [Candidatus Omnitrophica bacterium]|nr:hypothetical protein [Candidatus Omnitrophota bacterium]
MSQYDVSRRSVLLGGASLLGIWRPGGMERRAFCGEFRDELNETQRRSLQEALKSADEKYDPEAKMVASSVSSVGYHTTLKNMTVHPTRTSFEYAVALLDSGEPQRLDRAQDILRTVIAQQDQDPTHHTYGIWSWYLEEPLDKMSPPDWNWADFCGAQLLAAWIDHRDRLSGDVEAMVRESIIHACHSIQKRNVSLGYTNIAIMGTYVTLTASDRFGLEELQAYAKARLRRYHKYLFERGSFNEYNSPTYTMVAINELTRMLMHVRDEEDLKLIREIHDFAWKHATCRFHAPTRQWAGPHSRCYSTLLRKGTVDSLEFATGERGRVAQEGPITLPLSSYRLKIQCPPAYLKNFHPKKEPQTIIETFIPSKTPEHSIVGTTYLHPLYTLGTVNRGDFWNQRRSFVAYWGGPEKTAYLQMRFLHDGYDYCSALPFTVQEQGCAMTAVVFATDYGDTHPSLDRVKNASIRARDFRLRFEFGGYVDEFMFVPVNGPEGMLFLKDREIQLQIRPLIDPFGDSRFQWEIGGDDSKQWIDAVAYSGDEKEMNFSQLEKAFLAFAFQILPVSEKPISMGGIGVQEEDGRCQLAWMQAPLQSAEDKNGPRTLFHLEFPARPDQRKKILETVKTSLMTAHL